MPLWETIDVRTIAAVTAVLVSVVSAGFSIRAQRNSQLISKTSLNIAKFNTSQSYRKQLQDWASEAMDILSKGYILSYRGDDGSERNRSEILSELTSSIDKGRWLLPNHEHEFWGQNKESAFSGFRQGPLDDLVMAYDTLNQCPGFPDSSAANELMKAKRRFASAIQDKLEPRAVQEDLEKFLEKSE